MIPNWISRACIGATFEVHDYLGPGLLEKSYRRALALELVDRAFASRRRYGSRQLACTRRFS